MGAIELWVSHPPALPVVDNYEILKLLMIETSGTLFLTALKKIICKEFVRDILKPHDFVFEFCDVSLLAKHCLKHLPHVLTG